jgi:hypothetical protein
MFPALALAVTSAAIPATATAVRVTGEPSEETWRTAVPIDAFVQREPHDSAAPGQRAEFRIASDERTLFVKFRAFDNEPDRIVSYLTRRDLHSPCDRIHIMVDSYHDKRTAYGAQPYCL